jgi:hypothetical protein
VLHPARDTACVLPERTPTYPLLYLPCSVSGDDRVGAAGVTQLLSPAGPQQQLHFVHLGACYVNILQGTLQLFSQNVHPHIPCCSAQKRSCLLCSVTGDDKVGAAGVTQLLSPAGLLQLHFVQYGGLLWINNLQLEGRAGSGGGGGVLIKRSRDGSEDNAPATTVARTVTFK